MSKVVVVFMLFLFIKSAMASVKWEYFVNAGSYYSVNPYLLYAIAKVESGLNPYAVNVNKNGTRDLGLMQINERWLRVYPVRVEYLFDPQFNVYMGAFVLRQCMNSYGNTWKAVDCYNKGSKASHSSRYVWNVYNTLVKIARGER